MPKEYGASQTAVLRYETYRKAFRQAAAGLLIAAIAVLVAVIMTFWAIAKATNKETVYFATREDGTILPMVGNDQPYLTDAAVLNFAATAVTESLSLSFVNLEDSLYKSNIYFTKPEGWEAFIKTMNESQMLEFIRTKRVVTSVVAKAPRIVSRGNDPDGSYFWLIQLPVTINYNASSASTSEDKVATLKIVRVPTWTSERAMAIRSINIGR